MAEPTMAPSAMPAIFAACSGVEMPKPMAQGVLVFSRNTFTMAARSVLISLRVPVTPRLDTIYKKPGLLPEECKRKTPLTEETFFCQGRIKLGL